MSTCPDCGGYIKAGKCVSCGFQAQIEYDNKYCSYESRQFGRCKLLGTVSDTVRGGPGTKFYCSEHFVTKGTDAAEKHSRNVNDGKIVYKNELKNKLNEKMEEIRKSNPEIFWKPAEDERDEYVAMIMSYLKSRRSITKKLPYDKNKKQE